MTDPVLFLLASLALLGAPGPTNTLLAIAGTRGGIGRAFGMAAAVVTAYGLAILAYRLALAPVLATYPPVELGLKIAVALYVGWLAIRLWQSGSRAEVRPVGLRELFVTTLLNPKALVAAINLIPRGPAEPMLAGLFGLVAMATSLGWVLLGSAVAAGSGRHAAALPKVAAVALAGFAGLIAASTLG